MRYDETMKQLLLFLALLPAIAPAEEPGYHDPGIKVVVQVAIVCRDIGATSQRWAAVLGVDPPQIVTTRPGHEVKAVYRGRPTGGQAKLAFIRAGQVTIELIQPVGGNTSWSEFLDANGEGVQHVAFKVMDLDSTVKGLDEMGIPVLQRGRWDSNDGDYVYVDSKKALGVVLELLHADTKKD